MRGSRYGMVTALRAAIFLRLDDAQHSRIDQSLHADADETDKRSTPRPVPTDALTGGGWASDRSAVAAPVRPHREPARRRVRLRLTHARRGSVLVSRG